MVFAEGPLLSDEREAFEVLSQMSFDALLDQDVRGGDRRVIPFDRDLASELPQPRHQIHHQLVDLEEQIPQKFSVIHPDSLRDAHAPEGGATVHESRLRVGC